MPCIALAYSRSGTTMHVATPKAFSWRPTNSTSCIYVWCTVWDERNVMCAEHCVCSVIFDLSRPTDEGEAEDPFPTEDFFVTVFKEDTVRPPPPLPPPPAPTTPPATHVPTTATDSGAVMMRVVVMSSSPLAPPNNNMQKRLHWCSRASAHFRHTNSNCQP
jgi:hypothetical protein